MKNKLILSESKRKQIIAEKEQLIIESFAKTFNKIKRIDENELDEKNIIEEGWKQWLASGLITLSTVAGVYKFNQNEIKNNKEGIELVQQSKNILDKMSLDDKKELIQTLVDKGRISQLQSGLHLVGVNNDKNYVDNIDSHNRADDSFITDKIQEAMQSNPGWFGITAQGKIVAL